ADFALREFEHAVKFNDESRSIEMHLRSKRRQTVTIRQAELSVTFLEGETIWTESSHKYSLPEISHLAEDAGFRCEAQWIDPEWSFAENLLVAGNIPA
ncbi:MAG: L-histidine N(alpha)-methyltransferase, partial [Terriglobia bacterium]